MQAGMQEGARAAAASAPEGAPSLAALLDGTIGALARNDAGELERLWLSTGGLPAPVTVAELNRAWFGIRVLGELLRHTQRNLRLWRRAAGMRNGASYGTKYL